MSTAKTQIETMRTAVMARPDRTIVRGMSETRRPRRIPRRLGAVLAGFLTIVILSTATDAALHATSVYPPWGEPMADSLFLLATAYRVVFGVAG